jgi:hypothetical protein
LAACRLVAPDGSAANLALGSYLCIGTTGAVAVRQGRPSGECVAAIEVTDDNHASISGTAAINGGGLVSARVLQEGDVVTVGGVHHLVITP